MTRLAMLLNDSFTRRFLPPRTRRRSQLETARPNFKGRQTVVTARAAPDATAAQTAAATTAAPAATVAAPAAMTPAVETVDEVPPMAAVEAVESAAQSGQTVGKVSGSKKS